MEGGINTVGSDVSSEAPGCVSSIVASIIKSLDLRESRVWLAVVLSSCPTIVSLDAYSVDASFQTWVSVVFSGVLADEVRPKHWRPALLVVSLMDNSKLPGQHSPKIHSV